MRRRLSHNLGDCGPRPSCLRVRCAERGAGVRVRLKSNSSVVHSIVGVRREACGRVVPIQVVRFVCPCVSRVSLCAFHVVSPRDLWLCVLPRWQFNVNVSRVSRLGGPRRNLLTKLDGKLAWNLASGAPAAGAPTWWRPCRRRTPWKRKEGDAGCRLVNSSRCSS